MVSEIYKIALKVQIWNEVANGLVLKVARKKIHQNLLASKYDIRQRSDAP